MDPYFYESSRCYILYNVCGTKKVMITFKKENIIYVHIYNIIHTFIAYVHYLNLYNAILHMYIPKINMKRKSSWISNCMWIFRKRYIFIRTYINIRIPTSYTYCTSLYRNVPLLSQNFTKITQFFTLQRQNRTSTVFFRIKFCVRLSGSHPAL